MFTGETNDSVRSGTGVSYLYSEKASLVIIH